MRKTWDIGGRAWSEWADELVGELGAAGRDAAARLLAGSFAQRPLRCDPIPHAALNLERHASLDAIRADTLSSPGSVGRVADALAPPLPQQDDAARRELVSCAAMLVGSMWQIAHPPPDLAQLYVCDPELGHASIDFEPRLARLLATFVAGSASRGGCMGVADVWQRSKPYRLYGGIAAECQARSGAASAAELSRRGV